MKIITISRQFGSGGRELGKRLADLLGYDYYDKEIISAIAQKQGLSAGYIESALENQAWQTVPLTFRRSFSGVTSLRSTQTSLLLEQKKVIESIAQRGRDCIIVGRNADVILQAYHPFNLFVCADLDAKIQRCLERAGEGEQLTPKEIRQHIRRIDKNRAQTRQIITGSEWGEACTYHLTVNTTGWNIKELTPAVAEFAARWFGRTV